VTRLQPFLFLAHDCTYRQVYLRKRDSDTEHGNYGEFNDIGLLLRA